MTWVPQSCTSPTEEQPLRVAESHALFATAVPVERVGPTELRVPGAQTAVLDAMQELAEAARWGGPHRR
jgi:hypothetical protein